MRIGLGLALVSLVASGCAAGASARRARIRVWDSGVAYAVFGWQPFTQYDQVGACKDLRPSAFVPPFRQPHAGTLRVIAPTTDQVVLPFDEFGQYRDAPRRQEPLWKPGEPIVIEAPGRHAPAFRVELPAPPPIEPIEPARQDVIDITYHPIHVWTLHDLPVRWRGGEDAKVGLDLIAGGRLIHCDFDGKSGLGVVPQALLSNLPSGEASFALYTTRAELVRQHGWTFDVAVHSVAVEQKVLLDFDNAPGSW
jgi:hypothetical protein